jgi:hypothetical protein
MFEWDPACGFEADVSGQFAGGEDIALPATAFLLEEVSHPGIGLREFELVSKALAIFSMEYHDARLFRHRSFREITDMEVQEVVDACGHCVLSCSLDCSLVVVGDHDASRFLANSQFPRFGSFFGPCVVVEGQKVLDPEIAPKQPGCPSGGNQCRFDRDRSASTHRDDEGDGSVVSGFSEQRSRDGLPHRCAKGYATIAPVGELASGDVQTDPTAIIIPVHVDDRPIASRTGIRSMTVDVVEAIDDCVLESHVREHRVVDRVVLHGRGHRDIAIGGYHPFPGKSDGAVVHSVRILRLEIGETLEDVVGGSKSERQPHGISHQPTNLDSGVIRVLDVIAEFLDFSPKPGGEFWRAGGPKEARGLGSGCLPVGRGLGVQVLLRSISVGAHDTTAASPMCRDRCVRSGNDQTSGMLRWNLKKSLGS